MEHAGLIRYFPEEGVPMLKFEDNKFTRACTQLIAYETEHYIIWDSKTEDNFILVTSKPALGLLTNMLY